MYTLMRECVLQHLRIHVHTVNRVHVYFFILETLKVTPERSFLNQNLTVKLVWRFESEKINITVGKFSKEFKFFHDGNEMEDAGGLATNIYTDKQYVDYKLEVKKPGTYIGIISQSNVTAIVNTVKCKYINFRKPHKANNLIITVVKNITETRLTSVAQLDAHLTGDQ